MIIIRTVFFIYFSLLGVSSWAIEIPERARDLGIPFDGQPGKLNAITDVKGVEVGQVTLREGDGKLKVGTGPIRTGVTAIHPRGKNSTDPVFAGWFTLNASGEMTGTTWLEERGLIEGPISITNTHSVGVVRDSAVAWMVDHNWPAIWHAPVVGETFDGGLNDINGFHVTKAHALKAMSTASQGPVQEGVVGGGTGMVCNGVKGGIGTSSRVINALGKTFTVGVLVQCNYNWDGDDLRIGGQKMAGLIPLGEHCFTDRSIERHVNWYPYCSPNTQAKSKQDLIEASTRDGSIIIVIATDAPLLPHQLMRLAKRPSLGLGRLGAVSGDGSGDIFVAFSTANAKLIDENDSSEVRMYPNNQLTGIFQAAVHATEEAIVNAMVGAETVIGASGLRVKAVDKAQLRSLFSTEAEQ
ncbi:MAG: P1 family peptidase [Pseudomonadales bacterium]